VSLEIVAEGLGFPEGPIALADGSVILVEIKRQTLSRCWSGRSNRSRRCSATALR